jgi:hypothetical protein
MKFDWNAHILHAKLKLVGHMFCLNPLLMKPAQLLITDNSVTPLSDATKADADVLFKRPNFSSLFAQSG